MKDDKAYKLLAIQEGISNRAAKELIDAGLVSAKGRKITVARGNLPVGTEFSVQKAEQPRVIFEDENLLVIDKPAFAVSEDIAKKYKCELLQRLDKETSGVLLLVKNEEFRQLAIKEYKNRNVEKIYYGVVSGRFIESMKIDSPLLVIKTPSGAFTKVAEQGKEALTLVEPALVEGKNSLVKILIETGRTHQIRVHLSSVGFAILGDQKYGGRNAERVMLHSYSATLFDKTYTSPIPSVFKKYGFSI